ncbi:hypothetical protein D3C73_1620470 [compost metagenome]
MGKGNDQIPTDAPGSIQDDIAFTEIGLCFSRVPLQFKEASFTKVLPLANFPDIAYDRRVRAVEIRNALA